MPAGLSAAGRGLGEASRFHLQGTHLQKTTFEESQLFSLPLKKHKFSTFWG